MSACACGCVIWGEHLAGCDGLEVGWDGLEVECRGCVPRQADEGVLCMACRGRLEALVRRLPVVAEHLVDMARASVASPLGRTGPGASRPGEGMLYPGALVELDEVHAVMASWCEQAGLALGQGVPAWGTRWTAPSAGDAMPIGPRGEGAHGVEAMASWLAPRLSALVDYGWVGDMLADMAEAERHALALYPMEARERRAGEPCPACGCDSLLVSPPAVAGAQAIVRCRIPMCGKVMGEAEWDEYLARLTQAAQEGA